MSTWLGLTLHGDCDGFTVCCETKSEMGLWEDASEQIAGRDGEFIKQRRWRQDSPDLRPSSVGCSPTLLACWSLLRRRFSDSPRGLARTSTTLETCPTHKNIRWRMYLLQNTPQSCNKSFTVPGAVTFYWALAAASQSPVLHRCWPAVSETWDHLPDCRK